MEFLHILIHFPDPVPQFQKKSKLMALSSTEADYTALFEA